MKNGPRDQHIAQLRKKVELKPSTPSTIVTVHGIGYRYSQVGGEIRQETTVREIGSCAPTGQARWGREEQMKWQQRPPRPCVVGAEEADVDMKKYGKTPPTTLRRWSGR